jgi:hypothetical protein
MPRRFRDRPLAGLIVVAIILCLVLAIYDLSSSNSVLASLWGQLSDSPTKGEQMRDNLIEQMRPPTR